MGRKFNRSRFTPDTERAVYKDQLGRQLDRIDLMDAIRGGEDSYLEFKVRVSNPEKLAAGICALANSGGGTMIFGVTDQLRLEGISHPEIVEQDLLAICREQIVPPVLARIDKVAFDSGTRIVVLEVDPKRAPHRASDGRYYVRVGSTKREATGDEIAEMYRSRTGARAFEDTPLPAGHVEDDMDEGALWSYVKTLRGGAAAAPGGFTCGPLLRDMRLAITYGDAPAPTVAGLLLFGLARSVARLLPQARTVVRRVSGVHPDDACIEEEIIAADVGAASDRVLAFAARYSDLRDARAPRRGSAPVAARPSFPRLAVLGAVTNAFVHRDYAQLPPIRVTLFDDRLEIANPAPDVGLTRRSLELGVREATNPRLKSLYFEAGYGADAVGGGVGRMVRAAAEFTRRAPLRITTGVDGFHVEIPAG